MTDDTKRKIEELLRDHKGINNPITSREINEKLDDVPVERGINIRETISELIVEEGIPVASCSKGYYLIQDEDELEEYVEQLESRAEGINRQKLSVQRAVGAIVYEGESRDFELKDKRSDPATIVKELVALGNTEGGTVVVGASEQGDEIKIQTIDDPSEWEESVNQCLVERVDPPFDVAFSSEQTEDGLIIRFSVDEFETLRTFDPGNERHCIPRRAGTTTTYLAGSEIARFYQ